MGVWQARIKVRPTTWIPLLEMRLKPNRIDLPNNIKTLKEFGLCLFFWPTKFVDEYTTHEKENVTKIKTAETCNENLQKIDPKTGMWKRTRENLQLPLQRRLFAAST